MFPHWKKSGMGEHKMAKNMFPTYTNRRIFEQLDILHAERLCKYIYQIVKYIISVNFHQNGFQLPIHKYHLKQSVSGFLLMWC